MYQTEIRKLAEGLTSRGISFELRPLWGGWQIDTGDWDAICHDYSYGHENDLLEIMGVIVSEDAGDSVEGYLTAAEVLERIDSLAR